MKLQKENVLTFSWKDGASTEYQKKVDVTGQVLRDKRMRVFTITPNMEIEQRWRWDE